MHKDNSLLNDSQQQTNCHGVGVNDYKEKRTLNVNLL